MSKLLPPHGSSELKPLLLEGQANREETSKAQGLKKVPLTSRETGDLIMMGIGAFTPLDGFMGKDDWKSCCDDKVKLHGAATHFPIALMLVSARATNYSPTSTSGVWAKVSITWACDGKNFLVR